MALKEPSFPRKLSTSTGNVFSAKIEATPHTPLSPKKKAFNKVNARLLSCSGLISARGSQDSDRKFMVRLIAARVTAHLNWQISTQPLIRRLALHDESLRAGANFYLITKHF